MDHENYFNLSVLKEVRDDIVHQEYKIQQIISEMSGYFSKVHRDIMVSKQT